MAHTINEITTLEVTHCSSCHVMHALPAAFLNARRKDRMTFYCPNGHTQWYPGKTDAERAKELEAQLEAARRTVKFLRDDQAQTRIERDAAKRSAAAYKGALTKARKRVGKGTCPECKRHFPALREHMASQHPEHATKETP